MKRAQGFRARNGAKPQVRVLIALPGLHRVNRGAEVALEAIGRELAAIPGFAVTLAGSGPPRPDAPYRFRHVGCVSRERFARWPKMPLLRTDCMYEDLTFFPGLARACLSQAYDVTVTCNYPYCNWALRLCSRRRKRSVHVYVTENGDWPAQSNDAEFRFFSCGGLVCTNPEYYDRNRDRWFSTLIPNGIDLSLFKPGDRERKAYGLPEDASVVLIVSALIASKRVIEGIHCVSELPAVYLVVAGDGPLRNDVERAGRELMGERFRRVSVSLGEMAVLYRSADVLLHMSRDEPFGNIYLEGLATGLPIVAHDWASTRWILEDMGCLVDTSEPKAVVEALGEALRSDSPDARVRRRAMAERRFSWSRIARQYADFFEECLKRTAE